MWKIRDHFEILNGTFSKFYNPCGNLAFDKVIVSFKVIVKQCIPKKRKRFGIKIFKLCDSPEYTYDKKVYLGKDRKCTAQHVTATNETVTEPTRKVEGRGHKLYMNNFFSSPELLDDLATKQVYCCGTVRPNRTGMPQDLAPKTKKWRMGDIRVRTRADLTAILWWDKTDICITVVDLQLDAQNSYLFTYNTFIKILYMFRALPCLSSGGLRRNYIYAASGIVTLCR
jgi:hypothetical protein